MRALAILLALVSFAQAQSTPRRVILPGLGHVRQDHRTSIAANVMVCGVAPAPSNITATKLAGSIAAGSASNCGFAVYENSDSGARLATATGTCTSPLMKASGLAPFNLVAGTLYRICACAQAVDGLIYHGIAQAAACCQDYNLTQLIQQYHSEYFGTAANLCSSGAPPATTGTITGFAVSPGRNAPLFPMVMVEE